MHERNVQFESIAGDYDASLPAHIVAHYVSKRTRFLTSLCGGKAVRALDVGCGTGTLAARLQREGWQVIGLDRARAMLSLASQRGVRVVQGSSSRVPFDDGMFDVVYCVALLHHVAEHRAVRDTVREMVRVTRRGGVTVIWDHNPLNPYWPIVMGRVPQDTGEERLIPEREIRAALGGLPVRVQVYQSGFVPDFVPAAWMGLFQGMERGVEKMPGLRRVLCAHNVVIAHKDPG